jgi:murein DD-endopeptidase MepM/ murein hydrolase activator NlpD
MAAVTWRADAVLAVLLAWLAAPAAGAPAAGAPVPEAAPAPGSVLRWAGESLAACQRDGVRFAPLGGACLYPIDLAESGSVRIERQRGDGTWERQTVRLARYPYPTESLTVDAKYVAPSKADLARIEQDQKRAAVAFARRTTRSFEVPLAPPLASLPVGSRFGARRVFNGEARSPHGGTDYRAALGTPVLAVAPGNVVVAQEQYFPGKAVFVDHGDGLISMVFHLSEIAVREGEDVLAGQVLGKVGATGRVTGPHLHFALRWRGKRIEPAALLAGGAGMIDLAATPAVSH